MANIVIIDDDINFRDLLREHCTLLSHEVVVASDLACGRELIEGNNVDLVFLDVRLPDGNGLDLLPLLTKNTDSPEVIIITGMGDEDGAEAAIKNGAWDYLQKPLSYNELVLNVKRALQYHQKKIESTKRVQLNRDAIQGDSHAIRNCLDQVSRCAQTDCGVLITGETGTGKEIFARTIHANSNRSKSSFVIVDCASLPEDLVESELFGHSKGAFTGASSDRKGLVKQSDGGTLFLDEIGELSLGTQKKFLRLLQEGSFRTVGQDKEYRSDFRLIAATNRDLKKMVNEGRFRSDLFYRLNSFHLHLPPLRERFGDIEKLTLNFVYSICKQSRLPIKGVVAETLQALNLYPWPGNVRELQNTLYEAIISDPDVPALYPIHLSQEIRLCSIRSNVIKSDSESLKEQLVNEREYLPLGQIESFKKYKRNQVDVIEKKYLNKLMKTTNGDISKACAASGLSRSRLYGLLKNHQILNQNSL